MEQNHGESGKNKQVPLGKGQCLGDFFLGKLQIGGGRREGESLSFFVYKSPWKK